MTLPAGFSKVRLTDVDAVLDVQNQLVGFLDPDGSWSGVPRMSADGTALVSGDGTPIAIGVVTQAVRTADFTLEATDSGTIIPVTGTVAATLNAASDLTAPVEIRRHDAATLSITRTGTTAIDPATGSAWGTLSVVNKLSSIIIYPGSAADEYGAVKVGA